MSAPDHDVSTVDDRPPEVRPGAGSDDAEPEATDQAPAVPPVVIVMVTRDPGPWFEETLRSVAAQTYRNASLLVIDAGSAIDPLPRIAEVLPDARLRRLEGNPGFGPACNEVLGAVHGAAFYLFCHDDVALDPDAVQVMVEESFRSNAGVVGPKLVDWHHPDRLLQVGMTTDKTGYPAPYVDRGELDQSQHDSVRDVLYLPGAATLVRADLFAAVGGFDPAIDFHGEDLDLGWRARLAGARVVVAPAARVRHLEALGVRRPVDDRRRLQMRHRLRVLLASTRLTTRLWVVPEAFVVAFAEVLYALVLARFRQARDVAGAWWWNLRHTRDTRRRRKSLSAVRSVPDSEIRHLQVRGSARASAYLRGQLGSSDDRIGSVAGAGRELAVTLRSSKARTAMVTWLFVLFVLVVGSRDLIFGHIAAVGDLPVFGSSAGDLFAQWRSGWRVVGLGEASPNPTGLGFLGAAGTVLLGALGLLRKLLVLGMLPLGAFGMWRMCKPTGSRRARLVALAIYLANPLPYNAIAGGQWATLVLYGAAPWLVSQLAKASQVAPFGTVGGAAGPGVRDRPLIQRVVLVGVILALVAMLSPVAAVVLIGMALALVVGGALCGQLAGAGRMLLVSVGAVAVAFVLQLPWSLSLITDGWSALLGTSSAGGATPGLDELVRFETGPIGAGALGYASLVVAALALFIGRDWRLGWAVRGWALAVAGVSIVWVSSQGWLPADLPASGMVLAPAAVGLALAAAMGMAAFEVDLPDYHFGWRQILSLLAAAAFVLALLPVVGASVDGRWGQPRGDYDRALSFLQTQAQDAPFRVLWIGDASTLPLASWPLDAPSLDDLGPGTELAFATSDNGPPTVLDQWPGNLQGANEQLRAALQIAAEGGTSRLGALLAPMGVRYVVVPLALAPEPYSEPAYPATGVRSMLEGQLDFSSVTASGVVLYENDAWGPSRALLPADTPVPQGGPGVLDRTFPAVQGAPPALLEDNGVERFGGQIDQPALVYLASAADKGWKLSVGGEDATRQKALGWANAFQVDTTGQASLEYRTPTTRTIVLIGQILLWLAAIVYILRVRVVRDERRTLGGASSPTGEGSER